MKIALLIAVVIVGLVVGGVLYARQKLAKIFGSVAPNKGDLGDLSRRVALPMMDDQWVGERTQHEASPGSAT
ncbi:MAG: hypothetical protein N2443_11285 [Blastocatellia bacterium]|nr:hypothetical protein [Blastocatellia bacterium]